MCPFESTHDPRLDALRPEHDECPRDLLPRLVEGDPLELLERCAHHLAAESLLLDLGQLHARSLAIVARRAAEATEENVEEWLGDRVCEAADQLIHEEHFEERLGFPPPREADPRSAFLMGALRTEPALARAVSVRFHPLSRHSRRTLWGPFLSGQPTAGAAGGAGG